jgi:uncharacterized protein (DUF2249 family)
MTAVMVRPGRVPEHGGGGLEMTTAAPAATVPSLVCHRLPAAERMLALLREFDALAPGQGFELHSDHPQKPALARLTSERKGLFEWSPLEEGPERWRTLVTRRPVSGLLREVAEALGWDHDRLDELERQAFAAREASDHARAARLFAEFALGLRRHIAFEEHLLFPVFEARSGLPSGGGPTRVMRGEHREIEQMLQDLADRFRNGSCSLAGPRAVFHAVLRDHNSKEESVLYPITDRLLSPEERDELIARIQAFAT